MKPEVFFPNNFAALIDSHCPSTMAKSTRSKVSSDCLEDAIVKLTSLASRHERNLCFNCDEKFHRRHKFVFRVFLLIADDDDGPIEDTLDLGLTPGSPDNHNPTSAQISFHSLLGHLALETLRLLGYIDTHQVVILVYGGSTHNFIQEPLA